MKKIIIALLLICTVSNVCAYAQETGKNSDDLTQAAEIISAFGIINGYNGASFGKNEIVKRSEAAAAVAGLLKIPENNNLNTFKDVPVSHRAKGYIEALSAVKIVSGTKDGFFEPDAAVTKYQAAVMLLNAMGYGHIAEQNGGYEKFILKLKLYDGILKDDKTPVTFAEFAKMILNALDKPLVRLKLNNKTASYEEDADATLLSEYLDIYEEYGTVSANEFTHITSEGGVAAGRVEIDGEVYYTGGTNVWKEIGRSIKFYYRDEKNGKKVILYYCKDGGKSIKLNAQDIISFENNILTYQEDFDGKIRSKEVKLSETADVIFNGQYKICEKNDFLPVTGSIELYDSDENGKYDAVYIMSYATYIADTVNGGEQRITDKYGKAPLEFKTGDFVNIELDGKKIEISEISAGDVLSVAANEVCYDSGYPVVSDKSEIYDIKVSRSAAEGKIEAMEDEYITVDQKRYRVSDALAYEIARGSAGKLTLGLSAKFYIDAFGEIAGFEKNTALPVEGNYGYAIEADISDESAKGTVYLKIFDFKIQDIIDIGCAKKVKVDGKTADDAEKIYKALCLSYNGEYTKEFAPRLIVYKTDSAGLVNFIDTDYVSDRENSENSLVFDQNQKTRMYANNVFGGDIAIGNDSVILAVPRIRASAKPLQNVSGSQREFICNKDSAEYIYFRKLAFSANSTKYPVESYNIKDNGQAAVIIYYYTPSSNKAAIGSDSSQTMIVDRVRKVVIGDGFGYEVRGFSQEKSYSLFFAEPDSVVADVRTEDDGTVRQSEISPLSLKQGDVIKYSNLKQNTNITLRAERLFAADKENTYSEKYYTQADKNSNIAREEYFNAFNVAYGRILKSEGGVMKADFGSVQKVYNVSSSAVCAYDKTGKTIKQLEYERLAEYQDVVVITANGSVKAVYAYNY